jgi:adenylate cyclase
MRVHAEEKLAAVLVADVADDERRIGWDRRALEAAVQREHHEIVDAAIGIYGGRIFELEPDHTFAEFATPLAAVRCAVEMQEQLERRAHGAPPEQSVRLRIGLHHGAALVERGELTGEALVIARRVHALAQAGEICVSRTVVEAVGKRVKHRFIDLATLPGRPVPRAALAFRLEPAPAGSVRPPPAWLATLGRLTLTAILAAAAVWLAMTGGRPS